MPVPIRVTLDIRGVARALDAVAAKQVPFAASRALNDVTRAARDEVTSDLPSIFDRPVAFTLSAIASSTATKSNLTGSVFVKPLQAKYLLPEEIGGLRLPVNNTRKTARALIVPSKIELDAFGNIPFGAIKSIVQQADAGRALTVKQLKRKKFYDRTRAKRDQGVFYMAGHGPGGKGPGGFFRRLPGRKLLRLISFEPNTSYRPIFNFRARVEKIVTAGFEAAFIKRLKEAVTTAK